MQANILHHHTDTLLESRTIHPPNSPAHHTEDLAQLVASATANAQANPDIEGPLRLEIWEDTDMIFECHLTTINCGPSSRSEQ